MITKKVEMAVGFVLKIITIAFAFCTSNQEPIEEKKHEYPPLYRQKIDVGEKDRLFIQHLLPVFHWRQFLIYIHVKQLPDSP